MRRFITLATGSCLMLRYAECGGDAQYGQQQSTIMLNAEACV